MSDRGIRRLVHLQNTGSSARSLNLLCTWARHRGTPEYSNRPFFENIRLNRAIILKHRLRRDELDLFQQTRRTATKIIFPIDGTNLKLGGQAVFVGQKNFDQLLEKVIGRYEAKEARDLPLLNLIDNLPSLDPFILREQLARNGYEPASCYLDLSDADHTQIVSFMQAEIEPLVRMSLEPGARHLSKGKRLVEKILSNALDNDLQALRQAFRLSETEFSEDVFCWKSFLYYKWVYTSTAVSTSSLVRTALEIRPYGKQDTEMRKQLNRVRSVLADRLIQATRLVETSLGVYDNACTQLTQNRNPVAFRDFLLNSPALFVELGDRLGQLQHLQRFCAFRFPSERLKTISCEELLDTFGDLEALLPAQEYDPPSYRAIV